MKALIKVGYACNENCTFCHTQDVRHIDAPADEVFRKIERAKALGHTMVVLSGGEPTIRPELFAWSARVAELGMDLGFVTNGLVFAYPQTVQRLLKHRLRYVYMSMHGGSAEVHNRLVRADTYAAAARAVENLAGLGLDVTINCVVTRQNVEHLREMVDVVLPHPDVRLKFSMVAPKGGGERYFELLTPRVSQVAARVHDALTYALSSSGSARARFGHDGLPLCLLPGLEDLFDDLKTHDFATMIEVGEPDYSPVDDVIKHHPPPCEGCTLRGPCPGLYIGYEQAFGDGELQPVVEGARSNAFNYVLEAMVARDFPDTRCVLREGGVRPWDRGRHLFVRREGRVARFRTTTRDFSDAELLHIKHDLGQVYFDASQKDAPDDFAADLVKLERSTLCDECPERPHCTGLYEASADNAFLRDDARLRALLSTLVGDVLDLGAGESPYGTVFEAGAREGHVRYVALDPDARRVRALAACAPWATTLVACAESLPFDAHTFDHVLLLRSWNHLVDPARALRSAHRVLRTGGSLFVVDNVAFGLARTRGQAARAEGSSAAFEHRRNDDAARAHRRITSAGGFELVSREDVGPGTSNQWLLRYVRATEGHGLA